MLRTENPGFSSCHDVAGLVTWCDSPKPPDKTMDTLSITDAEVIKSLAAEEKAELLPRLQEQEKIASAALEGSVRLAVALETIRDQQLYRAVHDTWDAYFASVWKPRIEKSGRRYFDMWKRHLELRDACRRAGLPEQALPKGEKVSRAAKNNITTAQAVELFEKLHKAGSQPTQSQVNKLRKQHGYDQLKRKSKTPLLQTEEAVAVNELREYLQEFSKAAVDWQVEAKDWSNTETNVKAQKVVQSLAPQIEVILELVMERADGHQLMLAYYDNDQKFGSPLNHSKKILPQKKQGVNRVAATLEEPPAEAPAVPTTKKRGRPKGSAKKAASKNGDTPQNEESAVYLVTVQDESGQPNTVSFTSEYEAKNEYEEQLAMGEKPVIIKEQNGRKEILMKAPGASVPDGDYMICPR